MLLAFLACRVYFFAKDYVCGTVAAAMAQPGV
jgi:hypothetical protein